MPSKHLRLVSAQDRSSVADALKRMCDDYVAALVDLVAQFLAPENIANYRIEGALRAAKGQAALQVTVRHDGHDRFENTKIFAAINAAQTFLGLKMDGLEIAPGLCWSDVQVSTNFSEPAAPSARRGLRLAAARGD